MKLSTEILSQRRSWAILAIVLLGWVLWLRGPSLSATMWNVDETIHATIAEVILDGGVLYRDTIDQRTPLSYYTVAAVFGLTGSSLPATRVFMALLVVAAAWMLSRTAFRINGPITAICSALIFAAFANNLLMPEDTFAVHTEWFVVFFTTAAAFCFLAGPAGPPGLGGCLLTGGMLGFAFMSKQSALLDLAPALVALISMVVDRQLTPIASLQRGGVLIGGFLIASLLWCGPLILAGAGPDLLYYAWTYNVDIYGAEFTFAEKVWSGLPLFGKIGVVYPVLLVTGLISGAWLLARSLQFNPREVARQRRPGEIYLLTWCITSLGAAMAGGRGFDHYFIPCLAPFAWVAAMGPAVWFRQTVEQPSLTILVRGLLIAFVGAVLYSVTLAPLAARKAPHPPADPALRVSAWIKDQSAAEDQIFVWGFNPDIYFYTDRRPASRFVYCTFQTGLIPWTNIAPEIDTNYARVSGSMDALLEDLEQHTPRYIVDSSAGPHRHFGKYPLNRFPVLEDWINRHYAEIEGARWGRQGFRLFARSDLAVPTTSPIPPELIPHQASIFGSDRLAPGWNFIDVAASAPAGSSVTGLALKCNDVLVAAVELPGSEQTSLRAAFEMKDDQDAGRMQALVQFDHGEWFHREEVVLPVVTAIISDEDREAYSMPLVTQRIEADGIRAAFGARAEINRGVTTFAMHAPAVLTYRLPPDARFLRGKFGLPEGAYSEDNPSPSDGAEFIVRVKHRDGSETEIFHQTINPQAEALDRGEHHLGVELPAFAEGDVLELEITAGPSGDAASDWTFWSELKLETSL